MLRGEKMLIECQKPWQRTVRSLIMINSKLPSVTSGIIHTYFMGQSPS